MRIAKRRTIVWVVGAAVASLALGVGGCPDDGGGAAETVGGEDALPGGRTFLLGGRAAAYRVQGARRWVLSLDAVELPTPPPAGGADGGGGDAGAAPPDLTEALVVPLHLYGVPWDEFTADPVSSLPGAWVSALQGVRAQMAATGKPLALALSPASDSFDNLAPRASDDGVGGLNLQENWLNNYCHDPSQDGDPLKWQTAYARYVSWVVDLFEPRFVFVARRLNLVEATCGEASPGTYAALAGFATAAHLALQERDEPPITVVTVDVEDLYGFPAKAGRCVSETPQACFEQRRGLLDAFTADRLGLESHPASTLAAAGQPAADWLSRVADARPEMPALIAGTGITAERLERQQSVCVPLVESTPLVQRAWLDQVLATAAARQMELVVWDSPRDQLDPAVIGSCPCSGDLEVCQHLSQLGPGADAVRPQLIEGLFTVDGTPRDAGQLWLSQLQ